MKYCLLIPLFFIALTVHAQTITIDFSGEYLGSSVSLNKVLVENLSNSESVELQSGFAVDLVQNVSVYNIENQHDITIFPNPFDDNVLINIPFEKNENTEISVCDVSGKLLIQKNITGLQNLNTLEFTSANKGVFFISVKSPEKSYSKTVICRSAHADRYDISLKSAEILPQNIEKVYSNPQLLYTAGDTLKFTGFYDTHVTVMTAYPTENSSYVFDFQSCIDFEGNVYPVVKLGNQWWTAENLKSTKYADGAYINGSYVYDNNSSNESTYGRLYTWSAIMNGASGTNENPSNVQGACPNGWHVPSESEWDEMRDYLGGRTVMGGKLKETGTAHWLSPNTAATNSSGMTIVPGGLRFDDGEYQYLGEAALFWNCSDFDDLDYASAYQISYDTNEASYKWNFKTFAQSLRCVMD